VRKCGSKFLVIGQEFHKSEHKKTLIDRLTKAGIEPCLHLDKEFDVESEELKAYHAIVIIGDDETYHLTINKILQKNISLPIGFIPQGDLNDLCLSLGISSFDSALDNIVARTVAKFDVLKLSTESEVKYCVSGLSLGLIPREHDASAYINLCCARDRLCPRLLTSLDPESYTVSVDGEEHQINSHWVCVSKTKTHMHDIHSPYGSLNDGFAVVHFDVPAPNKA